MNHDFIIGAFVGIVAWEVIGAVLDYYVKPRFMRWYENSAGVKHK